MELDEAVFLMKPPRPRSSAILHANPLVHGVSTLDRARVCIYGVKVSFRGSGTLKIVIYVENHPQVRSFRLDDYHPPLGPYENPFPYENPYENQAWLTDTFLPLRLGLGYG